MNQQSGELAQEGRIGPYRSLARLGEDGTGTLYRGTDPLGRDVAIKVLRPEVAGDPAARRRLDREIEMLRRVLSPHVVDVLDGDATGDRPYVVTRFVPGRSLDRLVAERGPLRGGALRRLALGLAKALTAVHEAGVVHRDLRPGTVLMVGGEPVVIDFGVSDRPVGADGTRTVPGPAGADGRLVLEPGSGLAPELLDSGPATPASDVYAWATTVAFAATGRTPSGQAAFGDARDGWVRPDGMPEPLLPLLRAALEHDPAARPTAAELVTAVTALDLGPEDLSVAVPGPVPADSFGQEADTATGPSPARPRPVQVGPRPRLAVGTAWSRLLAVLTVVLVAGVTIMMPVAGLVAAVLGALALRVWDSAAARASGGTGTGRVSPAPADVARAVLRTALTLPYAAVVTVVVTVVLASLVVLEVRTTALEAAAWGAGAGAAVLWTGPGVRAPRRQLERLFEALAPEPGRIVLLGAVLGALAFVSVIGAVSLTPSFAPMYGLQNSVASALDRLQNVLT
ncbi:Serine/threonine protein kinase [Thermomonospora echinospora]|uniref:Serine/threonine protein kinase n=1 Tax=Thermomonospora echinospora TaxID=1992 RepID=A0A1H5UX07_9ACTN|nr:serine/threonine-protein kinase [Thermomonospora echinospora]SEF79500.1 Serine/threonine protein kinase [Thermomonospora echinospora]